MKINQKHYKQLANSPLPFFCHTCLSSELPFLNITLNNLKKENFNSNYIKPKLQPCYKCDQMITTNKFIYCQLGNHPHPFHLSCTDIPDKSQLNYKIWSCKDCLNFPFSNLDDVLLDDILNSNHVYKTKNKTISFEDNFEQFKHLDKLNINLDSNNSNDELLNFEYYQIDDFIKMKQSLDTNILSLLHSNIRSFNKNIDSFADLLSLLKFKFDIIGLSETWNTNLNNLCDYSINGYHPFESLHGSSQNSGVGLFIKDTLDFSRRKDLSISISGKNCEFECLFLDVNLGSEHILVGVVYRHPSGCVKEFNQIFDTKILKKLRNERKKTIIMGDFNINLMNSNSHRNTELFLDNMLMNSMLPYITQPTRFTGKTHTLIDNIYYNSISNECLSGNLIPHVTDHLPNFLMIPTIRSKPTRSKRLKRDFSNFDILEFRENLQQVDFTQKLANIVDVNKKYDFFHNGLNILFEMHAPHRLTTKKELRKEDKPWMTEKMIKKIKYKDFVYGQYMKTKCLELEKEYLIAKKDITRETNKLKLIHLRTKFLNCSKNIKKFWKNFNTFFGRKKASSFPSIMKYNNKTITKTVNIAQTFNKHYSQVASNLIKNLKSPSKSTLKTKSESPSSFFFNKTSRYEILTLLNNLDAKKAKDLYDFPIDIIKASADLLAEPLSHIINHSVKEGTFPNTLKQAKVTPLFKSGPREDIKNYRPISVLPIFDKIFEKAMHNRLIKFLDKNNYLDVNQHGFQKGKSTSSAVLHLSRLIKRSLKKKEYSCAIFLDLAKAFDTVNHTLLIQKLNNLGVRGPILKWFKSYLTNRFQTVIIDQVKSDPLEMSHGVPQGSVLGPLLFLIYINDLTLNTSLSSILFADDTCLFLSDKDPNQLKITLNNELDKISSWLTNNKLTLNVAKSNFILFYGKHDKIKDFNLTISGERLQNTSNCKYLGVLIDDKFNWKQQVNMVSTKLKRGVGMIHKIGRFLSKGNLISLYYSLIQSHLTYCITSWGGPETAGLNQLNKLITKCSKFINNKPNDNPTVNQVCFKPLSIQNLFKLEACKLVHKFLNDKLDKSSSDLFTRHPRLHDINHPARRDSNNSVAVTHFDQTDCSVMFNAPLAWRQFDCYKTTKFSIHTMSRDLKKRLNQTQ